MLQWEITLVGVLKVSVWPCNMSDHSCVWARAWAPLLVQSQTSQIEAAKNTYSTFKCLFFCGFQSVTDVSSSAQHISRIQRMLYINKKWKQLQWPAVFTDNKGTLHRPATHCIWHHNSYSRFLDLNSLFLTLVLASNG